jgi:hypothetical protein
MLYRCNRAFEFHTEKGSKDGGADTVLLAVYRCDDISAIQGVGGGGFR